MSIKTRALSLAAAASLGLLALSACADSTAPGGPSMSGGKTTMTTQGTTPADSTCSETQGWDRSCRR